MKILYGEGDFLSTRHQILAYPATAAVESDLDVEASVMRSQPDVRQSMFNMFAKNEGHFEVIPPKLGDVIWTQTSGNKWIASMLIFDERGDVSWDALELCIKSVKKKAIALDQDQIGIPLRWFPEHDMKMYWLRAYDIIENVMSDEKDGEVHGKFQIFAYDPDSKFVRELFESLPGEKRAFYSDVQIRFKNR